MLNDFLSLPLVAARTATYGVEHYAYWHSRPYYNQRWHKPTRQILCMNALFFNWYNAVLKMTLGSFRAIPLLERVRYACTTVDQQAEWSTSIRRSIPFHLCGAQETPSKVLRELLDVDNSNEAIWHTPVHFIHAHYPLLRERWHTACNVRTSWPSKVTQDPAWNTLHSHMLVAT